MQSPINISTLAGVRLDVYASETVEVNMGGISLLSLEGRTATYTNTFRMPRTPINESVFGYASQPTRNNKAVVDVMITKGIFQRKARLTVTNFATDYSVTISYDSDAVIEVLQNNDRDVFPQDATGAVYPLGGGGTAEAAARAVFEWQALDEEFRPYMFASYSNTTIAATISTLSGNTGALLKDWLTYVGIKHSLTFTGNLLTDADFLTSWMLMPNYCFKLSGTNIVYSQYIQISNDTVTISEVLKTIAQIFAADVIITGTTIELKKLSSTIANTPIAHEGFKWEKQIYSGYLATNNIKYTSDVDATKTLGMDTFTGDGEGVKDVITINSFIPATDGIGYITNDGGTDSKICIFNFGGGFVLENVTLQGVTAVNAETWYCNVLSMSGVYSDILDPIMSAPIILKATRYFTPLEAEQLRLNRVLTSVQLGGKYWVDSMAYNLTTGNSVMTLIKI